MWKICLSGLSQVMRGKKRPQKMDSLWFRSWQLWRQKSIQTTQRSLLGRRNIHMEWWYAYSSKLPKQLCFPQCWACVYPYMCLTFTDNEHVTHIDFLSLTEKQALAVAQNDPKSKFLDISPPASCWRTRPRTYLWQHIFLLWLEGRARIPRPVTML